MRETTMTGKGVAKNIVKDLKEYSQSNSKGISIGHGKGKSTELRSKSFPNLKSTSLKAKKVTK